MKACLALSVVMLGASCADPGASLADGSTQAGPALADFCRPTELRAVFRGFTAVGDSVVAAVVVVDKSDRACWLEGSTRSVSLLDDDGAQVSVKQHAVDLPQNLGAVRLEPGTALPSFGARPPAGSAWFTLTWSNWCKQDKPAVQALLIVLPAGGSITAPLDAALPGWATGPLAPRCPNSHAASLLSFGRFRPPASDN